MRALAVALFALTSACSLTAVDEDTLEPAQNTCSGDSDCPGGECDTGLGVCKSTNGSFSNILVEVIPPANVPGYGNVGFLKPATGIPLAGGTFDVNIDVVAKVTGTVTPTPGNYDDCVPHYGTAGPAPHESNTAPVKLTFTPTAKLLGLSAPEYTAKAEWDSETETYQFEVWMPADTYDVYVEADPDSTEIFPNSCTIAPQFVYDANGKQWEVPAGDLSMPLVLQPTNQLVVTVPSPVDLSGWTVEMVHPQNGRLLSAAATLAKPTSGEPNEYVASVEYSKLWDSTQAGTELVRIRPTPCSAASAKSTDESEPCKQLGPTLVVQRSAVEWSDPGTALVDQFAKLDVGVATDPKFPTVTLQDVSLFAGEDGGYYQGSASIRFVSKEYGLELKNQNGPLIGVQAFFDRTITTSTDKFDVELLPGDYDVYVAPTSGSDFATTHAELLVKLQAGDVQNGKTITLQRVSHVNGTVVTSGMDPAVGAQIQAVASPSPLTALQIAAGAAPFKPQTLSGSVKENGSFELQGDPGTLDFSVLPADGTAFPWLVRPNVEVSGNPHELGEMQVAWPVIYTGNVLLPGEIQAGGAGGALIRAYVYLDEDGYSDDREKATSVIQIAETRAASDGSFRLFLPPHLN
jgi:hypothetical protein